MASVVFSMSCIKYDLKMLTECFIWLNIICDAILWDVCSRQLYAIVTTDLANKGSTFMLVSLEFDGANLMANLHSACGKTHGSNFWSNRDNQSDIWQHLPKIFYPGTIELNIKNNFFSFSLYFKKKMFLCNILFSHILLLILFILAPEIVLLKIMSGIRGVL